MDTGEFYDGCCASVEYIGQIEYWFEQNTSCVWWLDKQNAKHINW